MPSLLALSHPLSVISSQHNLHFKRWSSLLESKGIKTCQQCILFGQKVVKEALASCQDVSMELVVPASGSPTISIPSHVQQYVVSKPLFTQLDIFGTHFPLLICRIPEIPPLDLQSAPKGVELLCPLTDPSNVGALVRSCLAFGVDKVIFLEEAAHPCHPKAIRASSGAVLRQRMYQGSSLQTIQQWVDPATLVALDLQGEPLLAFPWPRNIRILVGREGQGLLSRSFSRVLSIPMAESANSLNAVVAASIALYAYRLRHPLD